MKLFESLGLSKELLQAISKLGFTEPTKVQKLAIPHIMEGKDVVGESATGSGKTLAFGCGIIEHCVPKKGIQAIVLTPTRELAEQVKDSLQQVAVRKKLRVITIYGGVAINPQIRDLERADVVVATPGRLLDHLHRDTIDTSRVTLLVLDEADRMLDMGFIDDVEKIMQACPQERQTLFFSATISPRISDLAHQYMDNPVKISATKQVDPSKLKQVYYEVKKNIKLSLLVHLLEKEDSGLVMVFCNTRRTTDFVCKNLRANKIDAIAIHGGFSQNKRTKTIKSFNTAKVGVLVCTDVAARGLHIDNVSHVYNYEIPNDPKEYVHRIGRTARAGEKGKVINLLCDFDYDNFSRVLNEFRKFNVERLEKPMVKRIMSVKVEERDHRGFRGRGRGSGSRFGRSQQGNYRGGNRGGSSRGNYRDNNRGGSSNGNRSNNSRDNDRNDNQSKGRSSYKQRRNHHHKRRVQHR